MMSIATKEATDTPKRAMRAVDKMLSAKPPTHTIYTPK
jgi:hypothetical protein